MKLPEPIRKVGTIDNNRKIYIEEYVLSYLEYFKLDMDENTNIILYGKKENTSFEEIIVIYGAEALSAHDTEKEASEFFKNYKEIGCLNMECWKKNGESGEGILIGSSNGGQPAGGFYVFCETNPYMEEYISFCYENRRRNGFPYSKVGESNNSTVTKEEQAELVAMSREEQIPTSFIFSFIKAAVICIFIIFCAIAVMTVNSYEKMNGLVETAVQLDRVMEEY